MATGENTEIMVSVIMITYNHEAFIRKAIEGVLIQECSFPVELLIGDDCSSDNTEAVVQDILNKHPKAGCVKYMRNVVNLGPSENYLYLFKQCSGKYIANCEGDDYWTDPHKLQKQVDFLETNPNCYLYTTNAVRQYEDDFSPMDMTDTDRKFLFEEQIMMNQCITGTVMFRKEKIEDLMSFDKFNNLKIGDILLFAIILREGGYGFQSKEYMGVRRVHEGGIYSMITNKQKIVNEIEVFHVLEKSKFFNNTQIKMIHLKIQMLYYDLITNHKNGNGLKFFKEIFLRTDWFNKNSVILCMKGVYRLIFG